ncbi:putative actin cortical patch component [Meredithblackwellia eburnea MCA 4105]
MSAQLREEAVFVPSPSTIRGQSTKLGTSPDGKLLSYGSGRNAIIRPIHEGTAPSQLFSHPQNVSVAKISPSGYYIATGDSAGNFKVWDTTGSGSIKLESKPIAKINDIAWDGESQRIVLVGDGRSGFGATFSLATGASIGEISGHSKIINSVAMKPQRPFRVVTASDDMTLCLSNGVPFKFASQSRKHSRFVTTVSYAPSGAHFVSAGSDGLAFLYDGTTGDDKGVLQDDSGAAHKGTIFQASFSKDSTKVATGGADGLVKLWDVASGKVVQTWDFGPSEASSLLAQQVGNVWTTNDELVSLSFSGALNVLDIRAPGKPTKVIHGHQTALTSLAISPSTSSYITGDASGVVRRFSSLTGECFPVSGGSHSNLVVDIVPVPSGDGFWSAGWDDSVRGLQGSGEAYSNLNLPTASIPKSLSPSSGFTFLATAKEILTLSGPSIASRISTTLSPTSVSASKDGKWVAVGVEESKVLVYAVGTSGDLVEKDKMDLRVPVTAVAFSPDSTTLAIGGTDGKIHLYAFTPTPTLVHSRFSFQSGRINSISFSPSGALLASGSLDESVRVYDLANVGNVRSAKNLHKGGVAKVGWEGEGAVVSVGADGAVKKIAVV